MTLNVLETNTVIIWIGVGALILFLFALTLAMVHRTKIPPGSKGYREGEERHVVVEPDAYIDSFSGVIEEAGGLLPPILYVFIPGILIWWLVYLIIRWNG